METDSIPEVLEDVSRSSTAETGGDPVRSPAVKAPESAAGAENPCVDVRQKLDSGAKGREKAHCAARNWTRDMIQVGSYARDVMDAILPSQRSAGLYKALPAPANTKRKSSSARQSAAQPAPAQSSRAAHRSENQSRDHKGSVDHFDDFWIQK